MVDSFLSNSLFYKSRIYRRGKNSLISGDLFVKQINYASPGFTDFMGLAAIIEQLKEILMHYIPNKKQEEK